MSSNARSTAAARPWAGAGGSGCAVPSGPGGASSRALWGTAAMSGTAPTAPTWARLHRAVLLPATGGHRAVGGVLAFEELAVQLGRLPLHPLQRSQAFARHLQRLGQGRSVARCRRMTVRPLGPVLREEGLGRGGK